MLLRPTQFGAIMDVYLRYPEEDGGSKVGQVYEKEEAQWRIVDNAELGTFDHPERAGHALKDKILKAQGTPPINRVPTMSQELPMAKKSSKKAETETVEAPETPAKADRVSQNGITRPSSDTKTGRVWEIADALSKEQGGPAKRADVLTAYEAEGGNSATGATQYGRWRKFHGLGKYSETESADTPEVEAADEE